MKAITFFPIILCSVTPIFGTPMACISLPLFLLHSPVANTRDRDLQHVNNKASHCVVFNYSVGEKKIGPIVIRWSHFLICY